MKTDITIFIFAVASSLMLFQGCATTSGEGKDVSVRLSNKGEVSVISVFSVRLSPQGQIYVGDRYTGLKKMVKQLKADGAKPDDRIVIIIPARTSPKALKAIGRELATNGYGYTHFEHEKKSAIVKGYR